MYNGAKMNKLLLLLLYIIELYSFFIFAPFALQFQMKHPPFSQMQFLSLCYFIVGSYIEVPFAKREQEVSKVLFYRFEGAESDFWGPTSGNVGMQFYNA